jgi:hypothetical protein
MYMTEETENTAQEQSNETHPSAGERDFIQQPATPMEIAEWTNKYLMPQTEDAVPNSTVPVEKNTPTEPHELILQALEKEGCLSKEEREQFLSPETVSSLSTEEYLELWRHLAPHYLSHVTRQGFRENSFTYHSTGLGEFHDGFKEMLENGKCLKSPNRLDGNENYEDVRGDFVGFLESLNLVEEPYEKNDNDVTEIKNPWKKLKARISATMGSAPNVPDEMAVHLAADKVLDSMYGAETGNQIFVIYPSDIIASQQDFAFNAGTKHSFTKELPDTEQKWNDVFVWDKTHPEKSELSVDAGLVFIPRSTHVDSVTGSRYSEYKRSRNDNEEEQVESKVPDKTITSEEYWTNFFTDHPEQKPSHVVFYDGIPTEAVQKFMEEHGITQASAEENIDENLDFGENRVQDMRNDPRTQRMESAVKRQAAIAILEYLGGHQEFDPLNCMGSEDFKEIEELASGYAMSYSEGGIIPGNQA